MKPGHNQSQWLFPSKPLKENFREEKSNGVNWCKTWVAFRWAFEERLLDLAREFIQPVNPKAEDGICRSKAEMGAAFCRKTTQRSPLCVLASFSAPSQRKWLLWCPGEVRSAVTAFSQKSVQLCWQCDVSRHGTLMQNKAVNGKCQLITACTLTTSQCIQNSFFQLGERGGWGFVSVQTLLLTSTKKPNRPVERRNLITQKWCEMLWCLPLPQQSFCDIFSQVSVTLLMTHVSANDEKWSKLAFLNCLFNPVTNTFYYISSKIIWKEERGAALLPRGLNSASTICQE